MIALSELQCTFVFFSVAVLIYNAAREDAENKKKRETRVWLFNVFIRSILIQAVKKYAEVQRVQKCNYFSPC